jgi:hypothetical protein
MKEVIVVASRNEISHKKATELTDSSSGNTLIHCKIGDFLPRRTPKRSHSCGEV